MKTPEEVAREALRLTIVPRANMGTASEEDMDRVTAAIAAERQRADALAEALRNFMNGVSTRAITSDHDETFANACAKARTALAAYDAEPRP